MKNKIQKARETMANSFKKDPDFEYVYISNIACLIHDNNTRDLSWKECNVLAKKVLDLIFF